MRDTEDRRRDGIPGIAELPDLLGLGPGELLFVDSAPLIYLVEGEGRRRVAMAALYGAAGRGELRLAASVLAWTELLRKADKGEKSLSLRRLLADSSRLVLLPIDVAVADGAATLLRGALRPGPSLPDALHLASALVAGAAAILTNDTAFRSFAPRGLRIIILDELAASISML